MRRKKKALLDYRYRLATANTKSSMKPSTLLRESRDVKKEEHNFLTRGKTKVEYESRFIKVKGIPFQVRVGTCDKNVLDEVITGDCYQLEYINLRRKPNIVDVGGHIGGFTKYAAWKWPLSKIHTIEANPMNYEILESNLGPILNKVTIYKGACVGKIPKNKKLVINKGEADTITGGWGIIFHEGEVANSDNTAVLDIDNFYNLSDIMKDMDKLDLLKLDCEGSEFSILKELTDEELYKIDYLVCEIHCGALLHHNWTYESFRNRILNQFVCPQLEEKLTCSQDDLFNIVACNRKLI